MPEANNQNKAAAGKKSPSAASRWPDISGISHNAPSPPPAARPPLPRMRKEANRGDSYDAYRAHRKPAGCSAAPSYPVFTFPPSGFSRFSRNFQRPSLPQTTYYGQVRFLNASTNGINLGRIYRRKGVLLRLHLCHRIHLPKCIRRLPYGYDSPFQRPDLLSADHGPSSPVKRVTLVILDSASGVTLAKVSDMGCTNIPSGYGCLRVANMSYSGSSYDVRTFQNQIAFGGVGYKEVTSYKQAAAGNHTFFVTGAQLSVSSFNELPIIILSAVIGGTCGGCGVSNTRF